MSNDIDPNSETIVDDVRRAVEEKAAIKRSETWEKLGWPTSELHMTAERYRTHYRGRLWCANKSVFDQMQQALKTILCPKCIKEESYGAIEGTPLLITIEDDVMTVFPAVGHFLCHHCGFEEWHPMKYDPRAREREYAAAKTRVEYNQQLAQAGMQLGSMQGIGIGIAQGGIGQSLAEYQEALQKQLGNALTQGLNPGMGAIPGMTESEKASLHRLYQQTKGATCPPPKIVESREEAEMLLRLAPPDRRKSIIQKLRDGGWI